MVYSGNIILIQSATSVAMFALVEKDPDIVILLDGSDELEKLTYYLKQRGRLHKRHHVRAIETALDYHFEAPDAGYSYCWEDGSLIKGSYMDRILHHSGEHAE